MTIVLRRNFGLSYNLHQTTITQSVLHNSSVTDRRHDHRSASNAHCNSVQLVTLYSTTNI